MIVRNPFDALLSEWTRQKSDSHIGNATEDMFSKCVCVCVCECVCECVCLCVAHYIPLLYCIHYSC